MKARSVANYIYYLNKCRNKECVTEVKDITAWKCPICEGE